MAWRKPASRRPTTTRHSLKEDALTKAIGRILHADLVIVVNMGLLPTRAAMRGRSSEAGIVPVVPASVVAQVSRSPSKCNCADRCAAARSQPWPNRMHTQPGTC